MKRAAGRDRLSYGSLFRAAERRNSSSTFSGCPTDVTGSGPVAHGQSLDRDLELVDDDGDRSSAVTARHAPRNLPQARRLVPLLAATLVARKKAAWATCICAA